MNESLQSLRAWVHALREAMSEARLDYFRAQLQLKLLEGNRKDADRLTRQIQNLLNTARPKARKSSGANGLLPLPAKRAHSGRNANASPSTIEAVTAATE